MKNKELKASNLKVYKANKLIEARYNLTVTEQKLILFAASQIDSFTGDNFTLLQMKIEDFFEISGIKKESKNHKHIKKVATELMQKQVSIEKADGGWLLINWVASSEYKPKEGVIEFEFSQKMKPYLLRLEKHYKGYPLSEVMQLSSKHSIRLYELLIQYQYTNHRSLTITVEELRKKMGIGETEYQRFTNFETFVIQVAIDELNDVSNMFITHEKIKQGRRIHEIKFTFDMEESLEEKELRKLKNAGLANHIEMVREFLQDDKLIYTDIEIDKAYNIVHKKLCNMESLDECLSNGILSYMRYYYEYTKDKANRGAYNYFLQALEEDYSNLQILLKSYRDPLTLIYGKLYQ